MKAVFLLLFFLFFSCDTAHVTRDLGTYVDSEKDVVFKDTGAVEDVPATKEEMYLSLFIGKQSF